MFKRIFLFITTNILIMLVISVIFSITGIDRFISKEGLNLTMLLGYSAVVGFSGSLISLAFSRIMAKWMCGVRVIDPRGNMSSDERWLLETVYELSHKAGLKVMPQVGFYNSPEVNAFATGPTRNKALVAVSTGLYNRMDRVSAMGVIGHEVSHVSNGDMVTMTLLQGVINTFVIFLSRIAAWVVSKLLSRDNETPSHFVYSIVSFIFQIIFGILGSLVVYAFSRYREYHADKGGANLAGRDAMISALESLKRIYQPVVDQPSLSTFKIADKKSFLSLFSTHPDLDDRINRLKQMG